MVQRSEAVAVPNPYSWCSITVGPNRGGSRDRAFTVFRKVAPLQRNTPMIVKIHTMLDFTRCCPAERLIQL